MRYALITGASRGIGKAITIEFAKQGIPIIINFLQNEAAASETLNEVRRLGGTAELLPFDVSKSNDVNSALDLWEDNHPNDYISILVNNAGCRHDGLMFMMPDDDWHQVLNTTLNGFFYLTRRILKGMLSQRYGRIINISSLSGIKGMPGQTNYSAAKAALIGATKALAQEVASRKVTVNAVAPGFIETDMTRDLPQDELKRLVPMNRFGKPEEVAALVAFLASDDAAYITGETININGGLYT